MVPKRKVCGFKSCKIEEIVWRGRLMNVKDSLLGDVLSHTRLLAFGRFPPIL